MRRWIAVAAAALVGCVLPAATASADAGQVVIAVKPWTYSPAPIHIPRGATLMFLNADPVSGPGHSVTDVAVRTSPRTRFSSPIVEVGKVAAVSGVENLPPGTYQFTCRVHPFMAGTLIVD
jgi:plastocyanin